MTKAYAKKEVGRRALTSDHVRVIGKRECRDGVRGERRTRSAGETRQESLKLKVKNEALSVLSRPPGPRPSTLDSTDSVVTVHHLPRAVPSAV